MAGPLRLNKEDTKPIQRSGPYSFVHNIFSGVSSFVDSIFNKQNISKKDTGAYSSSNNSNQAQFTSERAASSTIPPQTYHSTPSTLLRNQQYNGLFEPFPHYSFQNPLSNLHQNQTNQYSSRNESGPINTSSHLPIHTSFEEVNHISNTSVPFLSQVIHPKQHDSYISMRSILHSIDSNRMSTSFAAFSTPHESLPKRSYSFASPVRRHRPPVPQSVRFSNTISALSGQRVFPREISSNLNERYNTNFGNVLSKKSKSCVEDLNKSTDQDTSKFNEETLSGIQPSLHHVKHTIDKKNQHAPSILLPTRQKQVLNYSLKLSKLTPEQLRNAYIRSNPHRYSIRLKKDYYKDPNKENSSSLYDQTFDQNKDPYHTIQLNKTIDSNTSNISTQSSSQNLSPNLSSFNTSDLILNNQQPNNKFTMTASIIENPISQSSSFSFNQQNKNNNLDFINQNMPSVTSSFNESTRKKRSSTFIEEENSKTSFQEGRRRVLSVASPDNTNFSENSPPIINDTSHLASQPPPKLPTSESAHSSSTKRKVTFENVSQPPSLMKSQIDQMGLNNITKSTLISQDTPSETHTYQEPFSKRKARPTSDFEIPKESSLQSNIFQSFSKIPFSLTGSTPSSSLISNSETLEPSDSTNNFKNMFPNLGSSFPLSSQPEFSSSTTKDKDPETLPALSTGSGLLPASPFPTLYPNISSLSDTTKSSTPSPFPSSFTSSTSIPSSSSIFPKIGSVSLPCNTSYEATTSTNILNEDNTSNILLPQNPPDSGLKPTLADVSASRVNFNSSSMFSSTQNSSATFSFPSLTSSTSLSFETTPISQFGKSDFKTNSFSFSQPPTTESSSVQSLGPTSSVSSASLPPPRNTSETSSSFPTNITTPTFAKTTFSFASSPSKSSSGSMNSSSSLGGFNPNSSSFNFGSGPSLTNSSSTTSLTPNSEKVSSASTGSIFSFNNSSQASPGLETNNTSSMNSSSTFKASQMSTSKFSFGNLLDKSTANLQQASNDEQPNQELLKTFSQEELDRLKALPSVINHLNQFLTTVSINSIKSNNDTTNVKNELNNFFIKLIESKNWEIAEKLLDTDLVDVNMHTNSTPSPLSTISSAKNYSIAQKLIKMGKVDPNDHNAIKIALINDDFKMIQIFFDGKTKPLVTKNLLLIATAQNNLEIFQFLLNFAQGENFITNNSLEIFKCTAEKYNNSGNPKLIEYIIDSINKAHGPQQALTECLRALPHFQTTTKGTELNFLSLTLSKLKADYTSRYSIDEMKTTITNTKCYSSDGKEYYIPKETIDSILTKIEGSKSFSENTTFNSFNPPGSTSNTIAPTFVTSGSSFLNNLSSSFISPPTSFNTTALLNTKKNSTTASSISTFSFDNFSTPSSTPTDPSISFGNNSTELTSFSKTSGSSTQGFTFDSNFKSSLEGTSASTFENTTAPSFGNTSTFLFGNFTNPQFGNTLASLFGSSTASKFGNTTPLFKNSSDPSFGSSSGPTFGNSTNSLFGSTSTASSENSNAPLFGNGSASVLKTFKTQQIENKSSSSLTSNTGVFGITSLPQASPHQTSNSFFSNSTSIAPTCPESMLPTFSKNSIFSTSTDSSKDSNFKPNFSFSDNSAFRKIPSGASFLGQTNPELTSAFQTPSVSFSSSSSPFTSQASNSFSLFGSKDTSFQPFAFNTTPNSSSSANFNQLPFPIFGGSSNQLGQTQPSNGPLFGLGSIGNSTSDFNSLSKTEQFIPTFISPGSQTDTSNSMTQFNSMSQSPFNFNAPSSQPFQRIQANTESQSTTFLPENLLNQFSQTQGSLFPTSSSFNLANSIQVFPSTSNTNSSKDSSKVYHFGSKS